MTFMCNSGREVNLHALFSDHSEICDSVVELAKTYDGFLAEYSCGTCLAQMINTTHQTQKPDFTFDETH